MIPARVIVLEGIENVRLSCKLSVIAGADQLLDGGISLTEPPAPTSGQHVVFKAPVGQKTDEDTGKMTETPSHVLRQFCDRRRASRYRAFLRPTDSSSLFH